MKVLADSLITALTIVLGDFVINGSNRAFAPNSPGKCTILDPSLIYTNVRYF